MQPFDINPTAPPSKPNWFNRKPMRHKPADYSQPGAYFITICTRDKDCIFGRVTNGTMHLNDFGSIAQAVWHQLPTHFPWAQTDAWIVMPNHVHGIIWIHGESTPAPPDPNNQQSDSSPQTLGVIVGTYKSVVTRAINSMKGTPDPSIWQRNYHDHIIRDARDLSNKRHYITQNPERWSSGRLDSPKRPPTGNPHHRPPHP